MTIDHSIDPANRVKPIEKISPDSQFQKKVFIECKKQALVEVTRYRTGLIMWTDRSKIDQGNAEAAVC